MEKDKNKIIEVLDLHKKYKKTTEEALKGISFYVEEGAFFSLLGPNGAGKTTAISILTTTLSKTLGNALVCGDDIVKEAARVRANIGVIFQKPSLDLNLTAEENIRFHVNLYGLYGYRPSFSLMPSAYQKRVKKLAKVLGIEAEINKPVKNLSGGMKRKFEILRSLMHSPKILFLDEPTTGLDPLARKNLWEYLQQIRKEENITIFLTTHYLEEAEGSDYICIINNGEIVSKGTPQEIKRDLITKFLMVDAKNREKLINELTIKKVKFKEEKAYVCVDLSGTTAQKVIQKIKTPLSLLDVHNPTLEEAYIEIISNNHEGN